MNNQDRLELLQEMINIGFGRSSAAIAELLNVFVTLNVPKVCELTINGMSEYLVEQIGASEKINLVKQIFRGDFFGETILVFPDKSASMLTNLLINLGDESLLNNEYKLEESLIEFGNIFIGACMGKIAELLNTTLSYNLPQVILKNSPINKLNIQNLSQNEKILVIKNALIVEEKQINVYLFIIINGDSLKWLYKTLDKNLECLFDAN